MELRSEGDCILLSFLSVVTGRYTCQPLRTRPKGRLGQRVLIHLCLLFRGDWCHSCVSHKLLAVFLVPLRDNLSDGPLNPTNFRAVTEFNLHDVKMIPLRYRLLFNCIFYLLLQFACLYINTFIRVS